MVSSNVLFDFVSFWNSSVIPCRRSWNLVCSCLRDVWRIQDITVQPKWRVEDLMYISGELAVFPSQTKVLYTTTADYFWDFFSKGLLNFRIALLLWLRPTTLSGPPVPPRRSATATAKSGWNLEGTEEGKRAKWANFLFRILPPPLPRRRWVPTRTEPDRRPTPTSLGR